MKRFTFLIRTLFLGGLFVAGSMWVRNPIRGITSTLPHTNTATIEADGKTAHNAPAPQPFLSQLLSTLELGSADDQLFNIGKLSEPEILGDESANEVEAALVQNTTPETRAIAEYLIESSRIGGTVSSTAMRTALSFASQGEPGALTRIAAQYRAMHGALAGIIPPEELSGNHTATLGVLTRFATFLEALAQQPKDSVIGHWSSDERKEVVQEAQRLQGELRSIVTNRRIVLPLGVLP